ncbi:unnamed protein product [Dibothriocephalus latus]|uniref:UBA domain-containing protein n=1 Tax=Dibothriocephalus latus TaxID=60516 RepID=A0A3P7QQG1_DIBLA|nr:unnamed protein product [Dibothriocephalus latus]
MGYSISEATSALDAARDNLTKATDLLASKQLDRSLSVRGSFDAPTTAPSRARSGARGGGRSGRGGDMKFAIDMEDDPGFDPVSCTFCVRYFFSILQFVFSEKTHVSCINCLLSICFTCPMCHKAHMS